MKKRYALLALAVFALDRVSVSLLNVFRGGMSPSVRALSLNATTVAFNWILPLAIVARIEGRGGDSLGLNVPREKMGPYALYGVLGIMAPWIYLGLDWGFIGEVVEQVIFIGLAEEFFFRGYVMTRLCDWLGNTRGLISSAVVFSLSHVVFIITNEGLGYTWFLASTGLQTLLGGLLLGYLYARSRNIVPGSIIHVSMNLYLSRLFP